MSLNESYPAVPESVPRARARVSAFAIEAGASAHQTERIRLAVSEAVTNAVVHAYSEGGGDVMVTAAVTGGELWILIADDGYGMRRRSRRPGIGMGLALIARASDEFSVVKRSSGGTEVRMRFHLRAGDAWQAGQSRGSVSSAIAPASPRFSTTA